MEPCIQKNGIIRCTGLECQTILHDLKLSTNDYHNGLEWLCELMLEVCWQIRMLVAKETVSELAHTVLVM